MTINQLFESVMIKMMNIKECFLEIAEKIDMNH
jgi:hypothetical protein